MSRARRRPSALALALLAWLALAWLGPWWAGDPLHSDFLHGLSADGGPAAPSSAHWLGTDRLFRDQLARLLIATRRSWCLGAGAAALAMALGTGVGVLSGLLHGVELRLGHRALRWRPEGALAFALDVLQSFPFLLLVLGLSATVERTTDLLLAGVLGASSWIGVARVVRSKTLQLRRLEFVEAALALGRSWPSIALTHLLPNLRGFLLATGAVLTAQLMVAESVLCYLGLGGSPEQPSWGRMLVEGQDALLDAPWLFAAPALALSGSALSLLALSRRLETPR